MTDTTYVVSGAPDPNAMNPVAPTLADAVTAAQVMAAASLVSANNASSSAASANTSAVNSANILASVSAIETVVIADLVTVQSDLAIMQNQLAQINNTAATLIGNLSGAQSSSAAAGAAALAATNAANSANATAAAALAQAAAATTAANNATTAATNASNSAAAAAASAATINVANLLAKANNLSEVASPATALTNLGGATLASPIFTGNPQAPTQASTDNDNSLATTAFVTTAIANLVTARFPVPSSNIVAAFDDQVGTTYTLQAADNGKMVTFTNAAAIAVTCPGTLTKGFNCLAVQGGAGQVTFAGGSGGTLHQRLGQFKTAGQFSVVSLLVTINSDNLSAFYVLGGDTAL